MRIVIPTPEVIQQAADALTSGDLVIVPTETVYGLAAIATNRNAVLKVFEAKGRPADNPLIVHVATVDQVEGVAAEFPFDARRLANAFWPGPLTLVLPKRSHIPSEVTAGLDSVAVRVPSHPVMRALLDAVDAPLAAPSANRFMGLSPTSPDMVDPDVGSKVAMILDGGQCAVGIESTVVDCVGEPRILRPGGITKEQIESVLGREIQTATQSRKSPGQYKRHYSPRTPVRLADNLEPNDAGLTFREPQNVNQICMPASPPDYATRLYRALAEMDGMNVSEIVVERPPASQDWAAVLDRLTKASYPISGL